MTAKAFATGFSNSVFAQKYGAIPWAAIFAALQTILAGCGKTPEKMIHAEQERIRKGKDAKCRPACRKAFKQNGVLNEKKQDQMWADIVGYSGGLPAGSLSFAE